MMGEITEEQLQKVREPIPFTPTKRLERDDVLYVTEDDIPHPIYGYAKSHKEYSVIDLRGYRKGYEPRLEISGIYTPSSTDTFRLQDGHLPPYQPTTTGDGLLAEMRRLGVHKAFRIGKPEVAPEEVPAMPEVKEPPIPKPYHEMTQREIVSDYRKLYKRAPTLDEQAGMFETHYKMIKEALKEGKPVPANVLKDYPLKYYPDLAELVAKPPAVKPEVLPMSVVEYDRQYSLEELREMARQEGLSPSGSKKEIAARLIARGVR